MAYIMQLNQNSNNLNESRKSEELSADISQLSEVIQNYYDKLPHESHLMFLALLSAWSLEGWRGIFASFLIFVFSSIRVCKYSKATKSFPKEIDSLKKRINALSTSHHIKSTHYNRMNTIEIIYKNKSGLKKNLEVILAFTLLAVLLLELLYNCTFYC